ncbi:MAG: hypothetical protein RR289_09555 [Niameybacter sp.]
METLHILNGECLRDYLSQYLEDKICLCFNECLIGGMVYERFSPSLTFYLGGIGLFVAGMLAWIGFRKYERVRCAIKETDELQ